MHARLTPMPAAQPAMPLAPGAALAAQPLQAALDSASLLQGQKAVTIVHNGALYRLQATKLGKLILTK